jgi:hypothetical protein
MWLILALALPLVLAALASKRHLLKACPNTEG